MSDTEKLNSTQVLPRVYVETDKLKGEGYLKTSITSSDGQNTLEPNSDGSINVNVISGGSNQEPVFEEQESPPIIAPTVPSEVFNYLAMQNQNAVALHVTANIEGIWRVYLNGALIRVHRTSPAQRSSSIEFKQNRPLTGMANLTVEFEVPVQNQHGDKTYQTFVAYEGYKI